MKTAYIHQAGAKHTVGTRKYELLWGDPCRYDKKGATTTEVWARGRKGKVPSDALISNPGLLEVYVIDVGQGDGVLMKTPNGKWHLIDGGRPASMQMTKKSAASFVRWKFMEDLNKRKVKLENVILTHPDLDHFGGLVDVLCGKLPKPGTDDFWTFDVEIENFYHCGMGRFAGTNPLGKSAKGTAEAFPFGQHGFQKKGTFLTELLDGKNTFKARPARPFTDDFESLAAEVRKSRTPAMKVRRLDHGDEFLPGYGADDGNVVIHVLGPIVETFGNGKRGLRKLGGDSITRNGHSVVLRVDYGSASVLLTGDLNTKSQKLLLGNVAEWEFACDVAKGCHHGADDVDLGFVASMAARATIISSGDNEDYAHPQPGIVGASSRYGREGVDLKDRRVPPLVYSTELARSVRLGYARRVREYTGKDAAGKSQYDRIAPRKLDLDNDTRGKDWKNLSRTPYSLDLVYGLVNVRTDGERILLATLEERGRDFDKHWIKAGISPS